MEAVPTFGGSWQSASWWVREELNFPSDSLWMTSQRETEIVISELSALSSRDQMLLPLTISNVWITAL